MAQGNESEGGGKKTAVSIPVPKSRRGAKSFFADVQRELKKVNWPSRQENMRLTGVVLGVCILMGVLLTSMSLIAQTLVELLTKGRVG